MLKKERLKEMHTKVHGLLPVVVFVVMMAGCKHNPVDAPIKDPRDFTWSIDTVGGEMWAMWGNSSRDLYIVGFNNLILHFDGQLWHSEWLSVGPGMPISNLGDFSAVYGFGPSNVFAVGGTYWAAEHDSSFIVHYDGSRWVEQFAAGGRDLWTIWGYSANDVWTGGHAGTLFHYDGIGWSRVPIDANLDIKDIVGFKANDVYYLGTRINSTDYRFNYRIIGHFDGSKWSIVDSMDYAGSKFGDSRLGIVGSTLYTVGYYGIYSLRNGKWQQELITSRSLSAIHASGPNNAYAVGIDMFHFDGVSWSQITNIHFEVYAMRSAWCSETDIFSLSPLNHIGTAVVHGR
jgi:hypothetical protein